MRPDGRPENRRQGLRRGRARHGRPECCARAAFAGRSEVNQVVCESPRGPSRIQHAWRGSGRRLHRECELRLTFTYGGWRKKFAMRLAPSFLADSRAFSAASGDARVNPEAEAAVHQAGACGSGSGSGRYRSSGSNWSRTAIGCSGVPSKKMSLS